MKYEIYIEPVNRQIMVSNLDTGFAQTLNPAHSIVEPLYEAILRRYPSAFERLLQTYKHNQYLCVKRFITCNFISHDHTFDFDTEDSTINLERVICPQALMNECTDYGVICNPLQNEFSKREMEILKELKYHTPKEVAHKLCIALDTVKNHERNMHKKSGCGTIVSLLNSVIL